jgi:hypothetical protein
VTIPPDNSPTDVELRAEVHRLIHLVVMLACDTHGPVPGVGTAVWWTAPVEAQIAALLVLAEAYLVRDPQQAAVERLKAMAVHLSQAHETATAAAPAASAWENTSGTGSPTWTHGWMTGLRVTSDARVLPQT